MRNGRNTPRRDRHRAIIRRDEPPCHICGGPIDYHAHHYAPESFTIDHITPIARGGTDTLDNLAAAHRKCNRLKSDRMPGEHAGRRSPELPAPRPQVGCTYETHRVW